MYIHIGWHILYTILQTIYIYIHIYYVLPPRGLGRRGGAICCPFRAADENTSYHRKPSISVSECELRRVA